MKKTLFLFLNAAYSKYASKFTFFFIFSLRMRTVDNLTYFRFLLYIYTDFGI